jgi:hypothetical protein
MERLDSGFKCDAQETRALWIEPLPIEVLSDRHNVENSREPMAKIWFGLEHLSVGYPTKTQTIRVFFSYGRTANGDIRGNVSTPKDEAEHRDWGQPGCLHSCRQSTLVTYTHWGHSYPIRPGPRPSGGICTTTVMTGSHRGQRNSPAGLPRERSDTPHAYSLQRPIRAAWVALQPWAQR